MKKVRAIIASVLATLALTGGQKVAAERLHTRFASSNYAYSSASENAYADLHISIYTEQAVPNSAIQVLVYAVSNTATASDSLADMNAFDIGEIEVECPHDIPGVFEFGEPKIETAQVANYQLNGREYYHRITCPYTGTGTPGMADFGYTNDNYLTIKNLINPQHNPDEPLSQLIYAPVWLSFTYPYSQQALMTVTTGRKVQMLATVMEQISIELLGTEENNVYCGHPVHKSTTGYEANFGTVDNLGFRNVAQEIVISTNLINGYVVTLQSDDQMRLVDQNPAVVCDGDGKDNDACLPSSQVPEMSPTNTVKWENIEQGRGVAYTLESNNPLKRDVVFDYTQGFRTFPDRQASQGPETIIKGSWPTLRSSNYICYRAVATENNYEGTYQNNLYFTFTAKF